MKLRITFLFLLMIPFVSTKAQDGKYGKDSVACITNIALFTEYYKQGNYTDATEFWKKVFSDCPAARKSTYIYGENMYLKRIEAEKDATKKQGLIDTLMMIYDQRIQYYGEPGPVTGRKAVSFYTYHPDKLKESLSLFSKSIELAGNNSEASVVYRYFQVVTEMYDKKQADKEMVLEVFDRALSIADQNILDSVDIENFSIAKQNIEALFGPFATCEDLISIYGPKVKAYPDSIALLKTVINLFSRKGCTDSPLYFSAAEKLFKVEPNAAFARELARGYLSQKDYSKAMSFYTNAVDQETNATKKSQYLLEMADLNLRYLKNFGQARAYAQKASSILPSWGKPYIMLGDIYASAAGDCGEGFKYNAVFWAVVDKYIKAKNVDASVASEANTKIATYSKYYPSKEDVFFQGFQDGQSYKLDCWIGETTTVRIN
ncbi:MAG TPA: hypothetical protein PKH65_00040 [Bacteroidia bacterium]|nr:hypothetical protein [Bacteroidia bacterium]HNT79042.1 hypothetical protein [Bacteroidia bacterium]